MNHVLLISALFATLSLAACDKQPTVVNVPATPLAAPAPATSQGTMGTQDNDASKSDTGKTDGTTAVIVTPPASAASAPAD